MVDIQTAEALSPVRMAQREAEERRLPAFLDLRRVRDRSFRERKLRVDL